METFKINSTDQEVQTLAQKIRAYLPSFNSERFLSAYRFALKAHELQYRKSGEPYIVHPIRIVAILADLRVDENVLIAALLHDVPEDTDYPLATIEEMFGKEVAFLVDGTTKLTRVPYQTNRQQELKLASIKKILLHTAHDIRVMLIKLADRLDNMRTLQVMSLKKRLRIAQETWEIYVPMANLIGLAVIRDQLKDLCFYYLYPRHYRLINSRLQALKSSIDTFKKIVGDKIKAGFLQQNFSATVSAKEQTVAQIFKSLSEKSKRSPDLEDSLCFEIVVKSATECYQAMGIIHDLFKPRPGNIEDHIAIPDSSGYQGLKTFVFGPNGVITECSIQTEQMALESKYGALASHFSKNPDHQSAKQTSWWSQRIFETQTELEDNKKFLQELKNELLTDRMFIFTPKGEVVELPSGANCLDFAYAIHSDIGNHAAKALVNNKILPLSSLLHNGDTVKILQNIMQKGPRRAWLEVVKTHVAKNKIKEALKRESHSTQIQMGREILESELNRAGYSLELTMSNKRCKTILSDFDSQNFDELFVKMADGSLPVKEVAQAVYRCCSKKNSLETSSPVKNKPGKKLYRVGIKIIGRDRVGLVKSILEPFAEFGISVIYINTITRFLRGDAVVKLTFDVHNYDELRSLFNKLEEIDGVDRVERVIPSRIILFYVATVLAFCIWILHPVAIHYLSLYEQDNSSILSSILFFIGFLVLFRAIFFLREITAKTFPEWKNTRAFWLITLFLLNFATITILAEVIWFNVDIDWIIAMTLLIAVYFNFLNDYRQIKKKLTPGQKTSVKDKNKDKDKKSWPTHLLKHFLTLFKTQSPLK